jgi:hypothetical protein
MHCAVKGHSGVELQLSSFLILRGIELEFLGWATLRLYELNCPSSLFESRIHHGSTNETEATWPGSYVHTVKVARFVFKGVSAYCVQTVKCSGWSGVF